MERAETRRNEALERDSNLMSTYKLKPGERIFPGMPIYLHGDGMVSKYPEDRESET